MEAELDEVEEGKIYWKRVLEEFYKGFHQEMEDAEEALKDTRLKVPDRGDGGNLRPLRAQSGRQVRQIRKIPRLSGLSRMQVYKAHRRAHAGQMPALWQYDSQAQEQARLCLLCLRTGRGVRLYDVGRANRERLPGMRADHVKRSGRGAMKPFFINPDCRTLPRKARLRKSLRLRSAEQAADEVNLPPEPAAAPDMKQQRRQKAGGEEDRCKKACCEETASAKTAAAKKDRDKKDEKNSGRRCRRSTQKSASRRRRRRKTQHDGNSNRCGACRL